MTDQDIILNLGGPAKVAELIKSKNRQRVQNWLKRGIPSRVKLEYPELFLKPKTTIELSNNQVNKNTFKEGIHEH